VQRSTRKRKMSTGTRLVEVSKVVKKALQRHVPVVALESTILTHGMPFPENLEGIRAVKRRIEEAGACPAVAAVVQGRLRFGLEDDELERICYFMEEAVKCSTRDLAIAVAREGLGGTTVAATMAITKMAGISDVFVTGGCGGVHRGQGVNDISADLGELGKTPVAVVCAGVKSILDIGNTLEHLETNSVPVLTLGQDAFPAFFVKDSGFKTHVRVETVKEAAEIVNAHFDVLKAGTGILFAVPNPAPLDQKQHDEALEQALREAEGKAVGKDITPFLLKRMNEITKGASLRSNLALVENNAVVGTELALELFRLREQNRKYFSFLHRPSKEKKRVLVAGAAALDIHCKPEKGPLLKGTSNPGTIKHSFGGVGRNIADAISTLGGNVTADLLTFLGNDKEGAAIRAFCEVRGIGMEPALTFEKFGTSKYCSVLDSDGELVTAVANMHILEQDIEINADLDPYELLVLDANMNVHFLSRLIAAARKANLKTICDPVSVPKTAKLKSVIAQLDFVTPNRNEFEAMAGFEKGPVAIITEGGNGVTLRHPDGSEKHYKPEWVEKDIISSHGAGDCFAGALAWSFVENKGFEIGQHIKFAMGCAMQALKTDFAVPERFELPIINGSSRGSRQ